jgi:transcriptional regulator of arginine metabolism
MKTKAQRILAIRNILEKQRISSQEELLDQLKKKGFHLTQATLSRDLKFIRAGRIPDPEKGYVYFIPSARIEQENMLAKENFPVNGFLSIDFAWHFGVLKTMPGYASSIASAIDKMGSYHILGTIAGDDTILVIPREGISPNDVLNELAGLIPELAVTV